jgi:hypothetical protein
MSRRRASEGEVASSTISARSTDENEEGEVVGDRVEDAGEEVEDEGEKVEAAEQEAAAAEEVGVGRFSERIH